MKQKLTGTQNFFVLWNDPIRPHEITLLPKVVAFWENHIMLLSHLKSLL